MLKGSWITGPLHPVLHHHLDFCSRELPVLWASLRTPVQMFHGFFRLSSRHHHDPCWPASPVKRSSDQCSGLSRCYSIPAGTCSLILYLYCVLMVLDRSSAGSPLSADSATTVPLAVCFYLAGRIRSVTFGLNGERFVKVCSRGDLLLLVSNPKRNHTASLVQFLPLNCLQLNYDYCTVLDSLHRKLDWYKHLEVDAFTFEFFVHDTNVFLLLTKWFI